jgi:N-acetyl-anhydromuramyl-L-alanine amidase AmpD
MLCGKLALADAGLQVVPAPVARGFRHCDGRTIDTIVLHTICNPRAKDKFALASIEAIMNRYRAAAHYLILRDGTICRLVPEQDVAFHAGRSKMPVAPYKRYVNGNSLGIEMACDKKSSPTEAQYAALARLVKDIKARYEIRYIFGHKDIAPKRKSDPWNFDWGRFRETISDQSPTTNSR